MNSKTVIFIIAIFIGSAAAMIWHVKNFQQNTAQDAAIETARLAVNTLIQWRRFHASDKAEEKLAHGIELTPSFSPLTTMPSALKTSLSTVLNNRQLSQINFATYSPYFDTINETSLSIKPFVNNAWQKLSSTAQKSYFQIDKTQQPNILHYAIAEPMGRRCLGCHNALSGSSKKDWQLAEPIGLIQVKMPITISNAQHSENLKITVIAYAIVLICGFLGIILMIIKHKKFTDELERLTATDPLTGLYNQTELFTSLKRETEKVRRGADSLCLISFDIDEFRNINDTFGHIRGDEILRHIGEILPSQIRAFDIPCRFTGDEFSIILPGCQTPDARHICERIIEMVNSRHPDIHLSMGIAQSDSNNALDSSEMLSLSQEKMNIAKKTKGSAIEP